MPGGEFVDRNLRCRGKYQAAMSGSQQVVVVDCCLDRVWIRPAADPLRHVAAMSDRRRWKEMMKWRIRRFKHSRDIKGLATFGAVKYAAADDKIQGSAAVNLAGHAGKMIRRPDVVMAQIGNPAAARRLNAAVIRCALTARIVREIDPNNLPSAPDCVTKIKCLSFKIFAAASIFDFS